MTCQDRDQDLLLYGLGDLSPWERWQVTRHLRSCSRCRARQQELAALSGQIAAALKPPADGNGPTGGSGNPLWPLPLLRRAFSPLILAIVLSLLTIGVASVWYVRSHALAYHAAQDEGCRPDLLTDKCK
jgi:anti-sigma factor RsiW